MTNNNFLFDTTAASLRDQIPPRHFHNTFEAPQEYNVVSRHSLVQQATNNEKLLNIKTHLACLLLQRLHNYRVETLVAELSRSIQI